MAVINVGLAGRAYDVRIDGGLLGNFAQEAAKLFAKPVVPIVADKTVHGHWASKLEASLNAAGKTPAWFLVEPGESSKSWSQLQALTDWLLAQGVDRNDNVVALGGGVVGDLTGFACAILKRGCGFIQLPTTLLAQVDSSVGGKTAINTGAGKNLIGAFHQPSLVLADTDVLSTLPAREMQAGYAEVIKYGLLGDFAFFEWCEANGPKVLAGDTEALTYAIEQSVAAKARIVAEDETERSGRRALLNLGHTFGHALEAETGFGERLLHGEAVAIGMVLAAKYSARLGKLERQDAERITAAIKNAGMTAEVSKLGLGCDGAKLVDHMRHDKKATGGTVPFLLLNAIGEAYLDKTVELDDVAAFLNDELGAA